MFVCMFAIDSLNSSNFRAKEKISDFKKFFLTFLGNLGVLDGVEFVENLGGGGGWAGGWILDVRGGVGFAGGGFR